MVADSCLVSKLSNFMSLGKAETEALIELERESRDFTAGSTVFSCGDPADTLFVVGSGWLFSHTMLEDGRRQVVRFHHPGDIVGLEQVPYLERTHSLECATNATLCPFPKSGLSRIFNELPRLNALVWSVCMMDQAIFLDRLRVLGRMSAAERVAHLFLEFRARLRLVGEVASGEAFTVPLTQEVLGDAVGLTNVYVSRTLRLLSSLGLVERRGHEVRLLDVERLTELSGFTNRLEHKLDLRWLPGAAR